VLESTTDALRPFTGDPGRAAIFLDVDGTLAPIVERAEDARVPRETAALLGRLGRRYGCVACVSGRPAAEARRLVGVGSITYAGSHGADLLEAGAHEVRLAPAVASWAGRVRRFAAGRERAELQRLRVRVEDKGAIVAFHWRGAPDEEAARRGVEEIAVAAEEGGFATHWGRKVLEVRPPVPIGKGQAVRALVKGSDLRAALFGGDDATDLDGFGALDELEAEGVLEATLRVGIRSSEGPAEIVERADLVVDGPAGFAELLAALARA